MFALSAATRSPLASPSALQHAFGTSFPFGAAESLIRTASKSTTPLSSPSLAGVGILPQHHQLHLVQAQLNGFSLKPPTPRPAIHTGLRPSLLRGATTCLPASSPQILQIREAAKAKPKRRLSFVVAQDGGVVVGGAEGSQITSRIESTLGRLSFAPAQVSKESEMKSSMIKDRVPTPYPKGNEMERGGSIGYFDLNVGLGITESVQEV